MLEVDAVVNDPDPPGRHAVELPHVALHRQRNRHDAVRVLIGGPLDEGGHVIRRAELLDFPRPVRLERVGGQDERHTLQVFSEATGQMRVPGVAVHEVDAGQHAAHREILKHRGEQLDVTRVLRRQLHGRHHAVHAQLIARFVLIAEAEHVHEMTGRGKLAGEVFDMHAGAAVDIGRVFVGQHRNPHGTPS